MGFREKRQSPSSLSATARHALCGLALTIAATSAAFAAGETRSLSLHNIHTKADLTITYKRDGRFDDKALATLNNFLRDWRQEQEITMDPQLFDMLWEVHSEVKAKGPIHIICGYRSPGTNEMLRSRSSGVARGSLHTQGKAIDFTIPGAETADIRAAALRIQGGGVGFYPGSNFVHMDVGSVRHWPRMTRDQLAKVFPNGRTVHVPSDGNPLPGYELAMADQERGNLRRGRASAPKNIFASLFGASEPEEKADEAAAPATAAAKARKPSNEIVVASAGADIPLPPARRAQGTFQIASASAVMVPAPRPAASATRTSGLANDVITERGYWQGMPEPTAAPRRPAPQAAAMFDSTVGLTRTDRVPAEVALAYASAHPDGLTGSLGNNVGDRTAGIAMTRPLVVNEGSSSIAAKGLILPSPELSSAVKPGERLNNPWVRGLILAPSLTYAMTTTTFGTPDLRTLAAFMHKPTGSVVMTFSSDPHLGITTERFSGSAVVFQSTMSFGMRTAALFR